jgi:transcriptional regulator
MYNPAHFRETRPEVLRAFIARHPLGVLIAHGSDGLSADAVPMQLLAERDAPAADPPGGDAPAGAPGTPGVLRGHIARANPLWRTLAPGASVLTLFHGAVHYVSPSWYPSKREHGRVVPTWNYALVQARGAIRFFEDPRWLGALVESLTDTHEHLRAARWRVTDAPPDYLDGMLRGIVGFEITLSAIEGKFKASQNRSSADRDGVRSGLRAEGVSPADLEELCRDAPA